MKTGRKVATAEEFSVAKGENLVANATNTVAMSGPERIVVVWISSKRHFILLMMCGVESRGQHVIE